ncbi:MAG: hypothetical protein R2882_05510 [Gemmatimonadales bacterium]
MHFLHRALREGRSGAAALADVVTEVERLAAEGTTEVTLLGQTVNSYHDGQADFADLLRAVGAVPGIRRVRFTSPYPTGFSERVVAAMAETPTVSAATCILAQRRIQPGAPPDAPALHPGGSTSPSLPGSGRPCPGSPSRPI